MVKKTKEPIDVLQDEDFKKNKNMFEKQTETKAAQRSRQPLVNTSASSTLQDYILPALAVIGALAILFFLWQFIFGGDDNSNDTDTNSTPAVTQVDEDTSNDTSDEDTSSDSQDSLSNPDAADFVKFEEVGDDEYKITGRVTSEFNDLSFDGNAGVVVESAYSVDTVYGGGDASQAVGDVDDVVVGDWVEVFAKGRISFSADLDYVLDVFDNEYFVRKIADPTLDPANQVAEDSDDDDSDTNDSSPLNTTSNSGDSDDIFIRSARVAGTSIDIDVTYPGCGDHDFDLLLDEIQDGSTPKITVNVWHDANGDSCERANEETVTFDMTEILNEADNPNSYTLRIVDTNDNDIEFTVR